MNVTAIRAYKARATDEIKSPSNKGNRYSPEFKKAAIRMLREQHIAPGRVCKLMNISPPSLYRWLHAHDAENKVVVRTQNLEDENQQLRSALSLLKQGVDLLYKTIQPKPDKIAA